MTLADLFNAPTTFTLRTEEGTEEQYRVRKPNQLEQGEYQRWLEQLAFDAINRRTYQNESEKLACLRMHDQDCAAGVYEWGGDIATRRLLTPKGFAKYLTIICRADGLTEKKAERLIEQEAAGMAAVMAARGTSDPKVLEAILASLGLPSDYLSRSSATSPTAPQETSTPSPA